MSFSAPRRLRGSRARRGTLAVALVAALASTQGCELIVGSPIARSDGAGGAASGPSTASSTSSVASVSSPSSATSATSAASTTSATSAASSSGAGGATSSATSSAASSGTGGTSSSSGSSSSGGLVPDPGPGNQVDVAFDNVSPNDTPAEATPLGTSTTDDITVWIGSNAIGGTVSANYFVFRSGPGAGVFTFAGCFSAPITHMTATVWVVTDGVATTPPVGTWSSTDSGGTGCFPNTTAPLAANTVYLFGVTADGGPGEYSL